MFSSYSQYIKNKYIFYNWIFFLYFAIGDFKYIFKYVVSVCYCYFTVLYRYNLLKYDHIIIIEIKS